MEINLFIKTLVNLYTEESIQTTLLFQTTNNSKSTIGLVSQALLRTKNLLLTDQEEAKTIRGHLSSRYLSVSTTTQSRT